MDNQIIWFAIAAVVIGGIVRVLKEDSPLPAWLHVPAGYRRALAVALGIVSAGLDMMANGAEPKEALASGLASALFAIGGHHAFIERIRADQELPIPFARDTGRDNDGDGGE